MVSGSVFMRHLRVRVLIQGQSLTLNSEWIRLGYEQGKADLRCFMTDLGTVHFFSS